MSKEQRTGRRRLIVERAMRGYYMIGFAFDYRYLLFTHCTFAFTGLYLRSSTPTRPIGIAMLPRLNLGPQLTHLRSVLEGWV